ncbi:MAG: hypothetical protein Ct9H300mP18_14560 [Candidatus Neomarinimicrobiota bacterium]|nr:MAG: hypothetical protein Ct9H300mP18_14560 [Candidatus Neomarinimicrobiota bacterium]
MGHMMLRILSKSIKGEIGIQMVPFKFLVFLPDQNSYKPIDEGFPDGIDYKTYQVRAA